MITGVTARLVPLVAHASMMAIAAQVSTAMDAPADVRLKTVFPRVTLTQSQARVCAVQEIKRGHGIPITILTIA